MNNRYAILVLLCLVMQLTVGVRSSYGVSVLGYAADAANAAQAGRKVAVSGVVRDAASGEPMVGATVMDSLSQGAVTNNRGYFSLMLPVGRHRVECSFLGYDTQIFDMDVVRDTIMHIDLVAKATDIDALVVVGNAGGVGTQFGKVTVSMQQLKYIPLFMGEQDIFKYLQMLPGVVGGREGSSEINIRGGSGDQTLIQLDGVPVYNQNHALGFVSIFNGQALSGAELYKGGLPASIGGRLSGAVSMTTRDGNKQEHKQAISVGLLTAAALVEGPLKKGKGSYLVSGRYFIPNLLLLAGSEIANSTIDLNYVFYDVTAKLTYDLNNRNTLSWSLYNGYDAFKLTAMTKWYENDKGKKEASEDNDVGYRWMTTTTTLKLNTLLGRGMQLNTSVYYSGMNSSVLSQYNNHDLNSWRKSDHVSNIHELGVNAIVDQNIGVHTLSYGLQSSYQHMIPKVKIDSFIRGPVKKVSSGTFDLSTVALFAGDNIKLGKWGLYVGLRIPVYLNSEIAVVDIEPRLGASFDINEKHTLYASLDRNTQPIFTLNRQFGGQPIDFWMPIKNNKLQSSNQAALGWKYRPIKWLFFSIEGYYKQLRNMYYVYNEDELFSGVGGYNIGNGYSFGGEFVAQYTGRTTLATITYTHSESKRVIDGVKHTFQYDIPYNLNVFVKQQTFRRGDRIHHASINVIFKAGIPYVLSNEVLPEMPFINAPPNAIDPPIYANPMYPNKRLNNYFRIDLNYSMEKKLKHGSRVWQISILNVTNHFNPQYVYPRDNGFLAITLMPIMPSFSYKRIF